MSIAGAVLSAAELAELARRRVTCPFLGPAAAAGDLPVHGEAARPLASIEDLAALGNSGGGDLGEVLRLFALGNHAFMDGGKGVLDAPVPAGLFSLDLPGSQGSHPGHSGMLQGDWRTPASGRFDAAAFDRLVAPARDGLVRRSDVGRFIAANLRRDPAAKVWSLKVVWRLLFDFAAFAGQAGPAALERIENDGDSAEARKLYVKLTKLLGEDNLVGSAGEFGLLFAFLEGRPGARRLDGEPALAVDDLALMFRDFRLPAGWRGWPKRRHAWIAHTTALTVSAARAWLHGVR